MYFELYYKQRNSHIISKVAFGEGVTRAGFKIRFKRNRFFFCFKSNINFYFPRFEFGGMWDIAFVMFCQTLP